jgi:hypothetical protein
LVVVEVLLIQLEPLLVVQVEQVILILLELAQQEQEHLLEQVVEEQDI